MQGFRSCTPPKGRLETSSRCRGQIRLRRRKRIKAIYLQTEEHQIKLVGVRPVRNLIVGDTLNLFVAENTPVYNTDGCNVICSYIALSKTLPTQKKEIQTQ